MSIRTLSICLTVAMIVLAAAGARGDGDVPRSARGAIVQELGTRQVVGWLTPTVGSCHALDGQARLLC
ncbi:MAG TPA: hypothetical protein VFG43_01225 [Geminicoccaceae bacterium]|nr:hypothetical protein [Geminicoccaceae bacterium]